MFENRQIFIRVEQGKIESDQWIEWSRGDFQQNSGNIKKIMLLNFWKIMTYLPCPEGCIVSGSFVIFAHSLPMDSRVFIIAEHPAPSSHFPVPAKLLHSGLHSTCE